MIVSGVAFTNLVGESRAIEGLQPASSKWRFLLPRAVPRAEFFQAFSLFDWASTMLWCHPVLIHPKNLIDHRFEFQYAFGLNV